MDVRKAGIILCRLCPIWCLTAGDPLSGLQKKDFERLQSAIDDLDEPDDFVKVLTVIAKTLQDDGMSKRAKQLRVGIKQVKVILREVDHLTR